MTKHDLRPRIITADREGACAVSGLPLKVEEKEGKEEEEEEERGRKEEMDREGLPMNCLVHMIHHTPLMETLTELGRGKQVEK